MKAKHDGERPAYKCENQHVLLEALYLLPNTGVANCLFLLAL
jgi:hypothetical protein